MDSLVQHWELVLLVVTPFTFLATIRLSLKGILSFPDFTIMNVLFNEGWCIFTITFAPWHIEAYARGEISPLPWKVFLESSAIHGVIDGFISVLMVCIVNMWILWIPSQIYTSKLYGIDKEKAKFARIINGLAGLLLLTPGNPFYKVIESL